MKTHRTTYTLLTLFFASLLVLWGLEYSGVRTNKERMQRESLILPELQSRRRRSTFARSRSSGAMSGSSSRDAASDYRAGKWSSL